jgi:heme-degrading monooxygenase HmoA
MMQMGMVPRKLRRTPGLMFHKMLGTGGGDGYGFLPDFTTYALLTVWEDEKQAQAFEADSQVMAAFREKTNEIYSLFLRPIRSRGKWSRTAPFKTSEPAEGNPLVVVLTRATLKMKYYIPFWKRVGKVSDSHVGAPGLLFSKGVGERPWIMQATFTAWESTDAMESFAHTRGNRHQEAIATTRRLNGFREELYARFQPVETRGSWRKTDPVGDVLRDVRTAKKRME